VERISSRHNPLVKRFREVAARARPDDAVLLDGAHLLREALSAGIQLETVAVADSADDAEIRELTAESARAGVKTIAVTSAVLAAISPVRTPSGIVAIAKIKSVPVAAAFGPRPQLVVVLHEIQDPGNVGAVIRVAEACGATGVVASAGTADPFGWKALRGAMGSAFRLPVAYGAPHLEYRSALEQAGVSLLAAVPRGGTLLPSADLRKPVAILLGGEGAGLPPDLLGAANGRVTIPMQSGVDSLNVAASAAIILYEAARQRGGGQG
jgi:TrmH family RNA methyltransferase